MKQILSTLLLLASFPFAAQAEYSFLTDFSLKGVEVEGDQVSITVEHPETFAPAKFKIIPGRDCLESFPPQCRGTIIRMDDQMQGEDIVETVFQADIDELTPYGSPTIIRIIAPETEFVINY